MHSHPPKKNRLYASVICSISILCFVLWVGHHVLLLQRVFCSLAFTHIMVEVTFVLYGYFGEENLVYVKPVLNWANICFVNLVRGLCRT